MSIKDVAVEPSPVTFKLIKASLSCAPTTIALFADMLLTSPVTVLTDACTSETSEDTALTFPSIVVTVALSSVID